MTRARTEKPADITEALRFLRPTAKFKFAKDQFYMVGKVMHEAATEIERLRARLAELESFMQSEVDVHEERATR